MQVLGEGGGFTLKAEDAGSMNVYLNIHGAVDNSSTKEVNHKVFSSLCALVLPATSTATWQQFETAHTAGCVGVSRKDVTHAFNWMSARTFGKWNDGISMTSKERAEYLNMQTPVPY